MMENDGGEGDDQGSGWFEVKKKHRISSKLSIQRVSGVSSNKSQSYSPRYQALTNDEVGNLQCEQQIQHSKAGTGFGIHSKVSDCSRGSSSAAVDYGKNCQDKLVVNQENKSPDTLSPASTKVTDLETGPIASQEAPIKENLGCSPKIKWGDLEDVVFIPSECCDDFVKNRTERGDAKVVSTREHDNAVECSEPVECDSSHSSLQEGKVTSEDVECFPDGILSSGVNKERLEGRCEEVCEIIPTSLGSVNANLEGELSNLKKDDGCARSALNEAGNELDSNDASIEMFPSSPVAGVVEITIQEPYNKIEDGTLNVSGVSAINEKADMNVGLQDIFSLPPLENCTEISIDTSAITTMENQVGLQEDSTDATELGEGEQGESKERFRQRLWCFLFENLNRAVDELYLLCELECDMEQMNEAILVLDEAASDFKELKSRVEHFESTKKSATQSSKDGMALNAKTDHRRPHALSWEVRRMTTSPHRAEILSSSLEAFKKIQQERARNRVNHDEKDMGFSHSTQHYSRSSSRKNDLPPTTRELSTTSQKQAGISYGNQGNIRGDKLNVEISRQTRVSSTAAKCKREPLEPIVEIGKQVSRKDRGSAENKLDKQPKVMDMAKKQNSLVDKEKDKEKEKRSTAPWRRIDAWKEKRNWEDILKSPMRNSSRVSHSPGLRRKGMEHARVLHDKLMSPEKKKKNALDLKREAEEKHARAMRIRSQLENERVQKLQRTSEKLNRVNEWQAVRSLKLREGMYARHQRSESRHEAYLAQVARRAGDESSKVNEVRFITSLNEENKKLMLRQKLHDSEMRRAEKLQVIRSKQKEDTAREEAVVERRKLLEAEKLQRLAETQRRKEEAQVRREEERRASSAAREAKAVEQLRRKEVRAKAQQEEAELLAQKLAERLSESEQRRKFYLEQIREKASMDFRDQSSPLLRRSLNKDSQNRSISTTSVEDFQTSCISSKGDSVVGQVNTTQQQSLKRRIKKIRQRLMALKYDFSEPPVGPENSGIGYRALVGTARAKIGRWLQDLQRFRQARKEGAASIGLIVSDMTKFLEGKDLELHASRQAGLLDFISSALPASHTSKPEACQVTVYLLRLLRVALSLPTNRSYFLAQNLLPPVIPMLSASLENYIKIAASSILGSSNILSNKMSTENVESIAEVLDGFLWTVITIIGHAHIDERQLQMQDGLLELIVAYQVVHRLRDLFALYDRPQVEGSPFPSSILLSLNFLAVLTSIPGTISSIDWETCISKAAVANKAQEPSNLEVQGIEDSSLMNNISGHVIAPPSGSGQMLAEEKLQPSKVILSCIPESSPLDAEARKEFSGVSIGFDNNEDVKCVENSSEIQNIGIQEQVKVKSLSPQKDENNSFDGYIQGKRTDECILHGNISSRKEGDLRHPVVFLLSVIAETGLVGLPSLLTAVLLQANNRLSSEQVAYVLPSNFEEVATGVLKVLNNLALLDITLLQSMLATPDLKMEFFHLMSFLLSHCTGKWKAANDQVGLLLLESLLLLGYFALFHPGNQAVLRWGKSPTILHKVCDLPFVFFSDPELTPILAGTLVAACYGCDQNRGVVQQELSTDMLLSVLKSCRQGLIAAQSDSPTDTSVVTDPCDSIQPASEGRKPQGDIPLKLNRRTRVVLGKGGVPGSGIRGSKVKIPRDSRGTKTCDEWALKHNLPASGTSSNFMLHRRFPATLLDKAQEFFAAEN